MITNDATRTAVRRVGDQRTGKNHFTTGGGFGPTQLCAIIQSFSVTAPPVYFCIRVATGDRVNVGPVREGECRDRLKTTLLNAMLSEGKNAGSGDSQSTITDKASMTHSGRGEDEATATDRSGVDLRPQFNDLGAFSRSSSLPLRIKLTNTTRKVK